MAVACISWHTKHFDCHKMSSSFFFSHILDISICLLFQLSFLATAFDIKPTKKLVNRSQKSAAKSVLFKANRSFAPKYQIFGAHHIEHLWSIL